MANSNPNTSGLKPFAKGQSGNPGGRPPASLRSLIRKALTKAIDEHGTTALEKWVDDVIVAPGRRGLVLDVLKFTDGATPTEDPNDGDDAKRPRIDLGPVSSADGPAPAEVGDADEGPAP